MWHFISPLQSMGIFFPINFFENMAKSWSWYKQKTGCWIQYIYLWRFKADLWLGCCIPLFPEQGEQLATCFPLLVLSWYFTMNKVRIRNSVSTCKELEFPLYLLDSSGVIGFVKLLFEGQSKSWLAQYSPTQLHLWCKWIRAIRFTFGEKQTNKLPLPFWSSTGWSSTNHATDRAPWS